MDGITFLGLIAGTLTTISFVPQVVKTWKTKSARDFSLITLAVLETGIVVWIAYGFMIDSLPIVLFNLMTFVLVAVLLAFKVRYK